MGLRSMTCKAAGISVAGSPSLILTASRNSRCRPASMTPRMGAMPAETWTWSPRAGSLTRAQNNFEKFNLGGIVIFLDYPSFFIGQAPLDPFLVEDLAGLPDRAWRALD